MRKAVIVVNRDEASDAEQDFCLEVTLDRWIHCLSYAAFDLNDAVDSLTRSDFLNIILFIGGGHRKLLDTIQQADGSFFEERQTLVPQNHKATTLKLKLDTRVVFYDTI